MLNQLRLIFSFLALLGARAMAAPCDLAHAVHLPNLAAALATHHLSLLVIAPRTGAADAATGENDGSLGYRIAAATAAIRPDVALDLDTLDNSGQSVADMLPELANRLSQRPVALVIWQAGTAEIARGTNPASVSVSLADATRVIAQANADLILVDPDPTLASLPAAPAIESTLGVAASHRGVAFYAQQRFAPAPEACFSHGIAALIAGA
jgi:hypothetical protein